MDADVKTSFARRSSAFSAFRHFISSAASVIRLGLIPGSTAAFRCQSRNVSRPIPSKPAR